MVCRREEAGLYDTALALAALTPCDPKTLARAARDLYDDQPAFAVDAGLLALHWLMRGYGYEISSDDVWMAFDATMNAAEKLSGVDEARERVRTMITASALGGDFVRKVLGRELDLS